MYNLLETGAKAIIKLSGYMSSCFYVDGGTLHCYNRELGVCSREDMTVDSFTDHLKRMIEQGATIELHTMSTAEMYKFMDQLNRREA